MILQRLCEAASWAAEEFEFPPAGYERGRVKWIIDLDSQGRCLGFVRTTSGESGRKTDPGKEMPCPFVDRSSNVAAQLLADRADYALGFAPPDASKRDIAKVKKRHEAFVELLDQCAEKTGLPELRAVQTMLEQDGWRDHVPKDLGPKDTVAFSVDGRLLIEHQQVRQFWAEYIARQRAERSGTAREQCLVCGQVKPIADRHPIPIKGIPGGQSSGCVLVGANKPAFESYGRKASLISPVCWDCAETYARVLNAFLSSDRHHYRLADRLVYVFWTRQRSDFDMNTVLFTPKPKEVRGLLESVKAGRRLTSLDENQFYALALSGSGGRVVVRDWLETTVGHVKANVAEYLKAQAIVEPDGQRGHPLGMFALLSSLIPQQGRDRWKELPPNLPAQFVHAVLTGSPLPDTLLYRAVARARAEQSVSRPRAAMVKLCLMFPRRKKEGLELTEKLNTKLNDPAYLCGRLLAVLERIQQAAVPGAKATLIDRYYGTASTAPASVFGLLMRQAQAHLAKLRKTNEPAYHRLEQQLEEIASRLSQFPKILKLNEQGRFALGYYQQRAADRAHRVEAATAKAQAAENQQADDQQSDNENA